MRYGVLSTKYCGGAQFRAVLLHFLCSRTPLPLSRYAILPLSIQGDINASE
jgi:hypothetical protein